MVSNGDFTYLPEDLVIEILTRLSVKNLLCLKSVCKHWYNLIKSPSFISQHYHHSNNQTDVVFHHCGGVNHSDTPNSIFSTYCDETLVRHRNFDYLNMTKKLKIAAPVNGLFLLIYEKHKLDLWNPAIRESRTIPELNPNLPKHFIRQLSTHGFGLDPITHDYEVISVQYYWDSMQHTPENLSADLGLLVPAIGVYSFAADSWNLLDPNSAKYPSKAVFQGLSVTVNEYHYWISFSYKTKRHTIFTFDMRNKVFQEVHCPSRFTHGWLSLCNDNIALFTLVVNTNTIDAWVMEVEGCWTKKIAMENLPELLRPIKLWKNNELMFENRSSELVLYNFSTRKTRNTGIRGLLQYGKGIFCYKESLVSVNPGSKKVQRRGLLGMLRDFLINKVSRIWI